MAKDNQPDNKAKKLPDPILEPVREYLEKRAAEDPQFAEKYANPKKSLEECCRYIYGEAHKRAAGSSCVYIPPEEVFGWAMHYYDEEDIEVTSAGYTGRAVPKPVELTEEQKAQAEKAALEKYEAQQLAKIQERERAKAKAEAEKRKAAREAAEARKTQEGEFNLFNLMGI